MKLFLTLALLVCAVVLHAQEAPRTFADDQSRFELSYPAGWQPRAEEEQTMAFSPGGAGSEVAVTLTESIVPLGKGGRPLSTAARDSAWVRRIRRLPEAQVRLLQRRAQAGYEELRYEYYYGAVAVGRTHVLGRLLRRGKAEFRLEYRAPINQDSRYLAVGQQLLDSFAFTKPAARKDGATPLPAATPAPRAEAPETSAGCDDKMYGIAAYRFHDGQWQDDCRTIHEFSLSDPTAPPKVHRRVLPFQSYALAKGFDNCLYSVASAPTDRPEYVYRYNPATREGRYTSWRLPAQGLETGWISASTDAGGNLYFLTGDGNRLARVNPKDGSVWLIWASDPTRAAPYYPAIGFTGAGTHGNFCVDEKGTVYMVYSTDGALLRVDLKTLRPNPDLLPIDKLPRRGGYSDVLLQYDAAGQRSLYLAGPKAVYKLDPVRRQAQVLRRGTYTDLAGCNLFQPPPSLPQPAAAQTASWQGRVLDAFTRQPLPQAQLRVGPAGSEQELPLSLQGSFSYAVAPGSSYAYHARLPGYLDADSTLAAGPGTVDRDILLRPLTIGATLPLKNVQFEQGESVLLRSSFPALDKLVALLKDNPSLTIELRGHTDNVGPPEKNVLLSEQRVATVKAYLVRRGIAADRITGLGLGGTQPMASNEQEETRRLNRRVEFRVTGLQ
ncbi:hypothetical protein GCM10023185_22580 [Hymenobacter saemangeumensis]|uniref:OmpA-like domain-containing protein n=1 Tax=Hymenobacter saemangeumensis TaxID=1084522 RepID=A0ABP8IFD8_9BACT